VTVHPIALSRTAPRQTHTVSYRISGHAAAELPNSEMNSRRLNEPILKGIEGADVIAMAVSKSDPLDLGAHLLPGGCDQVIGGPAKRRVNEREAIILAGEVGVDRA
jgi:hypothetical protein